MQSKKLTEEDYMAMGFEKVPGGYVRSRPCWAGTPVIPLRKISICPRCGKISDKYFNIRLKNFMKQRGLE